jgi:hypothetical protein
MKKVWLCALLLIMVLPAFGNAGASGRCCLTFAWERATGISEGTFYTESPQYQGGYGCPSSWGAAVVAEQHGWTVETAGRWSWNWVVDWASRGGLIIYALPGDGYSGPDGLMHAYYCDTYDVSPPDYGAFWCYDICNQDGRWWNAQAMRDYWSGWAVGVFR